MIHLSRLILLLICLPIACSHLPDIQPTPPDDAPTGSFPASIFLQGDWQLLHAIEATGPGGGKQTLLGLSQISSHTRSAHCVMMTLEGMVLFQATFDDGTLSVQRAVAPFDRPGMAVGIVEDLRMVFFTPDRPYIQTGRLSDGTRAYRYQLPDGCTQDIETQDQTHWVIHRYDRRHRLVRTVRPVSDQGRSEQGMPNQILLEARGLVGYQLRMTLVEAQPLTIHPSSKKVNP
jgi:hypothetical protein